MLPDVTVRANEDLIRRIESNEVTVIALLHLSNQEKEQGIRTKPVAYFLALGDNWSDATPVEATVGGSDTPPDIALDIRRVER